MRDVWLLVLPSLLMALGLGSLRLSKLTLLSPILSSVLVWEGRQCVQPQCSVWWVRAAVPWGKNLSMDQVYSFYLCQHTPRHPCGGQRMIFESCFIPFLSPGVGTQASSLDSKHLSLLSQPAGSVCSYMGAVSSSHLEAYLMAFLHGSRPPDTDFTAVLFAFI